jgi:diadenosine tetraphosphate (Ap4A) HIT family hydrolase
MRNTALRSPEMHERYVNEPKDKDFMTNAPSIKEFEHWRIIDNKFPYDTIAETHHMLVPKRQITEWIDIEIDEMSEWERIIMYEIPQKYDMWLMNTPKAQSVKDWLHFHLIVVK